MSLVRASLRISCPLLSVLMAALSLPCVGASFQAEEPVRPQLQFAVRKGDQWSQVCRQSFFEPGSSDLVEGSTYRTDYTAGDPSKGGTAAAAKTLLVESRIGDTVLPPPKDAGPIVEQLVIGRNGERAVLSDPLGDPVEFRLTRLSWFLSSGAAAKDTASSNGGWSVDLPGDEGGRVPGARVQFVLVGSKFVEGRKAFEVRSTFSEIQADAPLTATGVFFVDAETGIVLKSSIDAKNARLPGGDGSRFDLKIETTASLKLVPRGKQQPIAA